MRTDLTEIGRLDGASPTIRTLARRFVLSAVGMSVILGILYCIVLRAREQALSTLVPLPRHPTSTLCSSRDGALRATRVGSGQGGLVCETADGQQLYSIELHWHPFDGRLYTLNELATNPGEFQRWNPLSRVWEAADEGLLAHVHAADSLVPIVFVAFALTGCLFVIGWIRPWLGGALCPLGIFLVVLWAGRFVPITWHGCPISAAAFSPDGSTLATAGGSVICLWDARTGYGLAKLEIPTDNADAVEFSQDERKLIVSGGKHVLCVLDLEQQR